MRTLILLLVFCSALHARVGENKEALIKRFGKPLPGKIGDEGVLKFKVGTMIVTCRMSGKCVTEEYRLADGGDLSIEQVESVLNQIWRDYDEVRNLKGGARRWKKRGTYFEYARLSPDKKSLTFGMFDHFEDFDDKAPRGL